uniref:Uncharacterized protein n=1 Tax=Magnetococcus massalia (strain MO-1) TaxID=451514 RepID=A0A1S7LIH7_MAGMO|nr:protein of unknown function [Candidatus Magnetococcus massalia]
MYPKDSVPTNPPLSAKPSFLTPQSCLNRERFEGEDKRPPRRRGGYKRERSQYRTKHENGMK